MITQTAKYALRAIIFLARQNETRYFQIREIAPLVNVPANYLGKTLQRLACCRILDSQKGVHGGFRLARKPQCITFYEILVAIEAIPRDFIMDPADDLDGLPSPIYEKLAQVTHTYVELLRQTTLADLSDASPSPDPQSHPAADDLSPSLR